MAIDASAWADLELTWPDFLANTVKLPPLPPAFPLPRDGHVRLEIDADARSGQVTLRASADVDAGADVELWGLGLGRSFHFEIEAEVDAGALVSSAPPAHLQARVALGAMLRLPSLPAGAPLRLETGGADGWLPLTFQADVDTAGALALSARLGDGGVGLSLLLPGAAPDAPTVEARLDEIIVGLDGSGPSPVASLELRGHFVLHPIAPPDGLPVGPALAALFAELSQPVPGRCALVLSVGPDALDARLTLTGLDFELRPLALLTGLTRSLGLGGAGGAAELPIDLPIRGSLHGFHLRLARDVAASELAVQTRISVGDAEAMANVVLGGRELRFEIGGLEIPLALPRFPFNKKELEERYGHPEIIETLLAAAACPPPGDPVADPERDRRCRRLRGQRFLLHAFDDAKRGAAGAGYAMQPDAEARFRAWLGIFVESLDAATAVTGDSGETASYRITPRALHHLEADDVPVGVRQRLATLTARYSNTQAFWRALAARLPAHDYGAYLAAITQRALIRGATMTARIDGAEHVLFENLTLAIDHLSLRVPFSAPNQVRLEGAVALCAHSEPLGDFEVQLVAGVSADMIYFSLKAADGRIPIPDVGPYAGGSVRFGQFLIGFGYTKRSLALAFSGEVVLPARLVEDLDTSSVTVVGVRLPVQSRLNFRLDLIPVPGPDVVIIVPVFTFNLDLRQAGLPALRDPGRCAPEWDGLQLIVGEVFRFAVKHVAVSPMFGFLPAPNWILGGNLAIGTDDAGLALVIDEWQQIDAFWTPAGPKIALPGFSDLTPFVNDACLDLRFAGFGVHLHAQRPFPSLSPLAIPEVFALLSDPGNYPVDPRGELANSLRLTIRDTGIRLPEALLALFPPARALAGPPVDATINLGTFITLAQKLAHIVAPLLEDAAGRLRAAARTGQALARAKKKPDELETSQLLRLLPASLQRLETQVSFGGFEGQAVVALLTLEEARAALAGGAGPAVEPPVGLAPGQSFTPAQLLGFQPRLAGLTAAPPPSARAVLSSELFAPFHPEDLDEPALAAGRRGKGVLVGAGLRLAGERVAFLGFVSRTGAFALVAAADAPRLKLSVAGIDVPLPFQADVHGRLTLRGAARPGGVEAEIRARGHADWIVLAGMIEAHVTAADLKLSSDGRFAVEGEVQLDLFGGRLVLVGTVAVAPDHALVAGRLTLNEGPLAIDLGCTGALGPLRKVPGKKALAGQRMDITGVGKVSLFGQSLADVRARLSGEKLELEARFKPKSWTLFGNAAKVSGDLGVRGVVWFPPKTPAVRLEGNGKVKISWGTRGSIADVTLDGRAQIATGPDGTSLSADGTLRWQGRSWASGTLRATPAGATVGGHTAFTVELPGTLVVGVPRLVLRLDVQGTFTLDATGTIKSCVFDGHWLVGARLGEGDDHQILPLVAGGGRVVGSQGKAVLLANVDGFARVPGAKLSLTLPLPDTSQTPLLRVGTINDKPAIQINGTKISVRSSELVIPVPDATPPKWPFGTLTLKSPAYPQETGDELIGPTAELYPLNPSAQVTATLPVLPSFRVSLVLVGRALALLVAAGAETVTVQLTDGRLLSRVP